MEGPSLLVPRKLSLISFILPTVFTTFLSTHCTNSGGLSEQKVKDRGTKKDMACASFSVVYI